MAAIITEQFRRNSRKLLFDDINDTTNNSYYIGIGKAQDWSEVAGTTQLSPFPLGSVADQKRVRDNLVALYKTSDGNISTIIPKNEIASQRKYKVYDPYDPTCFYASSETGEFPCFVTSNIQSGNNSLVFLCIAKTLAATTVSSSAASLGSQAYDEGGVFTFDDGYTWVYLGTYDRLDPINNNAFVSFDFAQNNPSNVIAYTNGLVHNFKYISGTAASNITAGNKVVDFKISGYKIVNSVSTYTEYTIQNVNITVTSDKKISKISLTLPLSDSNALASIKNWTSDVKAEITTTGYENIIVAPIIAPIAGFEKELEQSLPSWYIGFYGDTIDSSYIPSGTSYRQISLIKNPKNSSGAVITAPYIQPLRYFTLANVGGQQVIPTDGTSEIDIGWKIKQDGDEVGAIAYIQQYDSLNSPITPIRYYYYTDQEVGFKKIQVGVSTVFENGDDTIAVVAGPATVENVDNNITFSKSSGEILFIDNRSTVARESGQNEELKIIIQL